MKTAILSLIALTVLAADTPVTQPSVQVWRYQLKEATVQYVGRGSVQEMKELFRFDTATGRTWRYNSHWFTNGAGYHGDYWIRVAETEDFRVIQFLEDKTTKP